MTVPFAVVTTFHAPALDMGQAMIESFDANWPSEIPLHVYAEGCVPRKPSNRVVVRDLHKSAPWLVAFKELHAKNPIAHGKRPKGEAVIYDYHFDAVRFANKTAAIIHAATSIDADVVIWCDADVIWHSPVPMSAIQEWFPEDAYLSWLTRSMMYPECGFYGLRTTHPKHKAIMEMWRQPYVDGHLFRLPEWHDSFVMASLIDHLANNGIIQWASLSGAGHNTFHPFVNGPLGEYADHMKGPERKEAGMSKQEDLLPFRRDHPYWQGVTSRPDAVQGRVA